MTNDREGLLLGIVGVTAFSFSLPATRLAVPEFGPILVGLGRAEVAAVIAVAVLLIRGERFPGRQYLRSFLMI